MTELCACVPELKCIRHSNAWWSGAKIITGSAKWKGSTSPNPSNSLTYENLVKLAETLKQPHQYRPPVEIVSKDYYDAVAKTAGEFNVKFEEVHTLLKIWAFSDGKYGSEEIAKRVCDLWFGEEK